MRGGNYEAADFKYKVISYCGICLLSKVADTKWQQYLSNIRRMIINSIDLNYQKATSDSFVSCLQNTPPESSNASSSQPLSSQLPTMKLSHTYGAPPTTNQTNQQS